MDDSVIFFFDLFGTMIFAATGAVKAVKSRLDLLGVMFFALTVGCGGGMLRDVLIGSFPVAVFIHPSYFIVSIITALVVFFLSGKTDGRWSVIVYFDAIGLGVFTGLGLVKAAGMGAGVIGMVMSGTFSAVGGGILRDVFLKEIPLVFTSDFYASASILGGLFGVILLEYLGVEVNAVITMTAALTTTLRIVAYELHFRLPVAKIRGEK